MKINPEYLNYSCRSNVHIFFQMFLAWKLNTKQISLKCFKSHGSEIWNRSTPQATPRHQDCKLHEYGVSKEACQLLHSYLMNRRQHVKTGCSRSEWVEMNKGVPQGSVLGTLIFNIFINDIIFYLRRDCSISNHIDGNPIGITHKDLNELKDQLVKCTEKAIKWFESNHKKSNTSKFQAIILKPCPSTEPIMVDIKGQSVQPSDCVKLLGVHVDDKLRFQNHISVICSPATRQTNAINTISKFLSKDCKVKLYNAFILSNFLYCSIVWNFCSSQCTYKIDKIQKRALQVVLND